GVGAVRPSLRVLPHAEQHDAAAGGPADETPCPAVDRFDPGRAPGVERRVIEPDGRAVEGQPGAAFARLPAPGNDPDVLNCPAAQDPAEVQFAAHCGGLPAWVSSGPFQMPGTDEAAEEHELAGVLGWARDVQCPYEPSVAAGRLCFACHLLSSSGDARAHGLPAWPCV